MVEDIPEVEASCWNFQLNAGRNIGCAKYVLLQNFKEHFGLYIFFFNLLPSYGIFVIYPLDPSGNFT